MCALGGFVRGRSGLSGLFDEGLSSRIFFSSRPGRLLTPGRETTAKPFHDITYFSQRDSPDKVRVIFAIGCSRFGDARLHGCGRIIEPA